MMKKLLAVAATAAVLLIQDASAMPPPLNCLDFYENATVTYKNYFFPSPTVPLTGSVSVDSEAPVLFPTSEAMLVKMYKEALSHNCRIRVRGAGHSANAVVTQRMEAATAVRAAARTETDRR